MAGWKADFTAGFWIFLGVIAAALLASFTLGRISGRKLAHG